MTSHLSVDAAADRVAAAEADFLREDRRFVLHGVPWETYVSLRDALDESGSGVRMTYLKGALELMSPSRNHEDYKKILARLVEAYAEEKDIDLRGFGSMTFRKKAKKRGFEPDECYSLGRMGKRPDIAIEVVILERPRRQARRLPRAGRAGGLALGGRPPHGPPMDREGVRGAGAERGAAGARPGAPGGVRRRRREPDAAGEGVPAVVAGAGLRGPSAEETTTANLAATAPDAATR